jgi:glutamate-ammonia-ligase adenylyltransferase
MLHAVKRALVELLLLLLIQQARILVVSYPALGRDQEAARAGRRVQHHARLNEEPTQLPLTELVEQREAVLRLWRQVLG